MKTKNKTKVWTVRGLQGTEEGGRKNIVKRKFEIYYTADGDFKTLSICDIRSNKMFTIPFDKIYEEITKNEGNHNNGNHLHNSSGNLLD